MTLSSPNRGYPLERIEGDVGSMAYWNLKFASAASRLEDLRSMLLLATGVNGTGTRVTAARNEADRLRRALAPDIAEAELLAGVLQRYGDAFTLSAARANELVDDIENAHAEWRRLSLAADHAGRAAMAAAYGDDQSKIDTTAETAREAVGDMNVAHDALSELWLEYEGYYTAWDEAYDTALAELSAGTGTQITSSARTALDALLAANSPQEVAELWAQLMRDDPGAAQEIIDSRPELIGNLDGIPYSVRAEANENYLYRLLDSDIPDALRKELGVLKDEIRIHTAQLISFDPYGQAQTTAALAYGDIDTATDVSVLVPGMMSTVDQMADWGVSARQLNAAVDKSQGQGATIAWFGYDSPNFAEEPAMSRAEYGAQALTSFLVGLDHLAPGAEIAVIAHSYGSTTAALAIGSQPNGLGVDQFITVGSAGLPNDEQIRENLESSQAPQIFATLSDDDFWAPIGQGTGFGHNTSPTSIDGAIEFGSDGGVDAAGNPLLATPGHDTHNHGNFPGQDVPGGYLMHGSESFYNVRQIITTGEPGTELGGEGSVDQYWDLVSRGLSSPGLYY